MKTIAISLIAILLTACTQAPPARSAAEDEAALMDAMTEVFCITTELTEEEMAEQSEELNDKAMAIYATHGFATEESFERLNKIGQEISDSSEKIAILKEKMIATNCATEEKIEEFFTPLEELGNAEVSDEGTEESPAEDSAK